MCVDMRSGVDIWWMNGINGDNGVNLILLLLLENIYLSLGTWKHLLENMGYLIHLSSLFLGGH
jgi:hypothetical protein